MTEPKCGWDPLGKSCGWPASYEVHAGSPDRGPHASLYVCGLHVPQAMQWVRLKTGMPASIAIGPEAGTGGRR